MSSSSWARFETGVSARLRLSIGCQFNMFFRGRSDVINVLECRAHRPYLRRNFADPRSRHSVESSMAC